jgi:hypothetical protein
LAVGESFSGTSIKPYEVKKDRQIPIFASAEEEDGKALEKEGQKLLASLPLENGESEAQLTLGSQNEPAKPLPQAPGVDESHPAGDGKVHLRPERRRIEQEPPERRRLLDRRWRGGPAKKLTQAEMSLEQVRVVRNDLSDSDLELAPRRAERSAQNDFNPFAPRPIAAIGRPTHEKLGMGDRVARWFRFLKKPRS